MNRPILFYIIVAAFAIVLGMIGLAIYSCGVR